MQPRAFYELSSRQELTGLDQTALYMGVLAAKTKEPGKPGEILAQIAVAVHPEKVVVQTADLDPTNMKRVEFVLVHKNDRGEVEGDGEIADHESLNNQAGMIVYDGIWTVLGNTAFQAGRDEEEPEFFDGVIVYGDPDGLHEEGEIGLELVRRPGDIVVREPWYVAPAENGEL